MKNFKRIIAVVTALAVMLSLNISMASAAGFDDVPDSAGYAEAVGLLTSFGIITGYEDGTFKPNNTITRAETAAIMVRALGRETEAKSAAGNTNYSDVAASHWASGYINVASDLGIINGFPEGTFLPEENVTYEQIVKMIVCALGYEIKAQNNGGYPMGYLSAASSAGVTKGISGYVGQEASRSTVARLIYNSLEIEMMEETSYSTGLYGTSYSTNGKTILNDKLDLEKVDAVVTDTYLAGDSYSARDKKITLYVTKVYGSTAHVNSAEYEKGSYYTFDAGDTDAAVYLGHAVTAYVGEDENTGKEKIFAVTADTGKNLSVEITSNRLNEEDSSDTSIFYLKSLSNSKYTELKLDSRYTLVVNGEIVTKSIENYFDDADLFTLIDNDNDNVYEFVFVSVFTSDGVEFVVSDVDVDDEVYYFEGDNGSFEADLDDDTVLYTVIRDGKIADFDDIDIGDVVTILDESRDIITIYVSSESVTGSVDEYNSDEDEYTIRSKVYTLSPAFAGSLDVGDYGTFYINYLGKIADSTVSSTVASGDYVFITNYDTKTEWNKTSYMIQAVTAAGAVKTYTIKSTKVKLIDTRGNVYKTLDNNEVYAYLLEAANDLSDKYGVPGYVGVARVKVSSSGTLSEIYLPGTYADFYAQTKYASDNSKEYSAKKGTYGTYDLSGKIVVFNIDKSEADLVDAVEVGGISDFFSDGDSYNFIAYGERNEDIEAIMITDGIASINYEQHATIITKVSQVTSNGEKTVRYTGITDGVTKTYTVDPDDSFDVEKGNIVLIEVGSDGYISALEMVAATTTDYDDLEGALAYGDVPTDDDADVYAGLVETKGSKTFTLEGVEDSFYNDTEAAYTLIDYTGREATYASSNFAAIKATNSTESFVVVRLYNDTVIDVFIFRMNAGTYNGGTSNIWENIGYVDEPTTAPTAPTEEPTEEVSTEPSTEASTEASSEATEASSEATQPSSEATAPSTEATNPSSEVTDPSTEATNPSSEATEPSSESDTSSLSGATEAPTEPATVPTQPVTEAPTEATTAPTQPVTEAPTEATTAPTQPVTEAPTEATTASTEPSTQVPTEPATVPTEAATGTELPTAPTEAKTEAPIQIVVEEPSEKPAEPVTEAPTEATTEAPTEVPTAPSTEATTAPTEPSTAPTEASEATTAPTEPATNAVKTDSSLAKAVLDLVNAERAKVNLPALKWSTTLAKAAEDYSVEMAKYSHFSHTGVTGSTLQSRLKAVGITSFKAAGENIAFNQKTAAAVVEAWMNSSGHKANILSDKYTEMGVGLAITADGKYYWTQDFLG